MALEDIVIIADTHLGISEGNALVRRRTAQNTVNLLKRLRPGTIILNGDIADLWVYYRYADHIREAQEQAAPYAAFLKACPARTVFIPGNCDTLQSPADIDRLHEVFTDRGRTIRFEYTRAFWDPACRLFVTHGHRLLCLARDVFQSRERIRAEGRAAAETLERILDPFTLDPAFRSAGDESARRDLVGTACRTLASAASGWAKRFPSVQRQLQRVVLTRLRAAVDRLREASLIGDPRWIVFSHTHLAGFYGDRIINTGTAGPQGPTQRATLLYLRGGTEPQLFCTYHPDHPHSASPLPLRNL